MQLAEYCGISAGYITEIEVGKKFPSIGVIEKIASRLKIDPYILFKNRTKKSPSDNTDNPSHLPYYVNKQLQNQLKTRIKAQVNQATSQILAEITDIVNKY